MSQPIAAFLIDKEYNGPQTVEGYVRKQSKQQNQLDKTLYFKIDLVNKKIERAPTKIDMKKSHKEVSFGEIFQIQSESSDNVDQWAHQITFLYKTKMKQPLTILLETDQLYQQFLSAIKSIYDKSRNMFLYTEQKVKNSNSNQQKCSDNTDTSIDQCKLTIKRRIDIYKKRNQSASSSRQNRNVLNQSQIQNQEENDQNVTSYTQTVNKKTNHLVLDLYKNHYFGRCVNRQTKTTINPLTSRTYQDNLVSETLIKEIEGQAINDDESQKKNINNSNLENIRPNFRKNQNLHQANQNIQQQSQGQHYSLTVPQTNNHTKRPSIIIEKDQINLNNGGICNNNTTTPYNSTLSTNTPRHSSISARSRKYKRQKNISFDSSNPSKTINFYADSKLKGQQQEDEQFSRLNKTITSCNYYEPNIDTKKTETDNQFYKSQNQDQQQLQTTQQDFYPSFTKKSIKSNAQNTATQNAQEQSDWSLVSIKSPKIISNTEQSSQDNIHQFFPGQKRIKIIRKRSSKLSNTTEDEEEIKKGLNLQVDSSNNIPSQKRMNHLLSNIASFKTKTEQDQMQILEDKEIGKEEGYFAKHEQVQENLLKEITGYQTDVIQKGISSEQEKHFDTYNSHKGQAKLTQNKQQQDNTSQLQHSQLLRPSSANKNYNENSCSPKKYGNIPKPQSGKKSEQKEIQEQTKTLIKEFIPLKIQDKPQVNSYLKQLYDFNQNKEMSDEIIDPIQDDSDAYKIILQGDSAKMSNPINKNNPKDNKNNLNDGADSNICSDVNKSNEIKVNLQHQLNCDQQRIESGSKENEKIKQNRTFEKSVSPLKNQTNKIQLQSSGYQQEKQSYQFNEIRDDNQNLQFNQQSKQLISGDQHSQISKASEQTLNKNKLQNQQPEKSQPNSQNLKSKQITGHEKEEYPIIQITKEQQNLKDQNTIVQKQEQQRQENKQQINTNSSKNNLIVKESIQEPIEYHDFDNSFDNESFSSIKKVDEIIKLIEEQSAIVLQNQNQIINKLNKGNILEQQKQNQLDDNKLSIDNLRIQIQQKEDQDTKQITQKDTFHEANDDQKLNNNINDNNQLQNSPIKNINYDWNSLKDPNYKPSTSPLKEKLYVNEDEENYQEQRQKSQSPDVIKKNDNQLMIVMVNKNESNINKKKEKPILRQRDVFSDEYWNPVTQPKNFKVTHQPPNLYEEKQRQKQILVPVKVSNDDQQMLEKHLQQEQNQPNKKYEEEKKVFQKREESQIQQNINDRQNISSTYGYNYQQNSLLDEVKDFFKPQPNNKNNYQLPFNNKQQNQYNATSSLSSSQNNKNSEQKIQNNYDDWDDYY